MKTITNWHDLAPYGIIFLTGESCGYGGRVLCDLSPYGVSLIEEFLGCTVTVKPGSNWNSDCGACGSILLPRAILSDLAVFVLLVKVDYTVVGMADGIGVAGMTEKEFAELSKGDPPIVSFGAVYRSSALHVKAVREGRNVHQATGRVS